MKSLGVIVAAAMNDKIRMSGALANQWVFGKSPEMPFDLLDREGQVLALQGREPDEELRLRQHLRAQADMHISQYKLDDSLRRAISRQGRPSRITYEPGELVAFWRNVKKKKGRLLKPGWYRGTIIGAHKGDDSGNQSNYWVTTNGKLILVSKEQLRPTYGTERWRIQDAELQEFLDDDPGEFGDETGDGPRDDDLMDYPNETVVAPMQDEMYSPSIAEDDICDKHNEHNEEEVMEDLPDPVPPQPPDETSNGSHQTDVTSPHPESPLAAMTRAPGTPVGGLLRQQPPKQPASLGGSEPSYKRVRTQEPGADTPSGEATPEPTASAMTNTKFVPCFLSEKTARPDHSLHVTKNNKTQRLSFATRKEQKALEREVPWNMIPVDQRPGYREALVKEWDTWLKYGAVEVLDQEASEYVRQNVDRKRVLATRVCYRNKNAAFPWMEIKYKARLVCRGDRDPDLLTLRRDAPTMTRLGLMVILQIAAAMPGWFMFNSDITGAFLQGDQSLSSRKEPLYLHQPQEGLPGLQRGQLLLVVRGIFGLANSPRLFWRHLRDSLLRMGFVQSTLDRAMFMYYQDEHLILVLGAHVDDLIGTGEPGAADKILDQLKEAFDFGAWADDRTEPVLEYGGKQIFHKDGVIYMNQSKFIKATTLSPVPRWRSSTPNADLLPTELTELRSVGGCLHWMIGQSRPDLAAGTSLHMSGKPSVDSLLNLNKLLKEAKASENWGLSFRKVDLEKAKVVVFSDSSWANADELRSQAGYMVFIAGQNVETVDGDTSSLVDWRSHRIKRLCRSTLAAETMAMDAAVDSGLHCRELMGEVLIKDYTPTTSGRLPASFMPVVAVTDCRSLYDLLIKDNPMAMTQEKRLAIDIGGLKEAAAEFDPEQERLGEVFRWVATESQLADHLTKIKPAHQLRDILDKGWISLQRIDDISTNKDIGECNSHVKS